MSNLKLEEYEGLVTVSRARSSNVATIIVNEAHGLITGDTVTVSGLGGTGYNDVDVSVTVVDSVTFTYANSGGDEGTTADTAGLVFSTFTMTYNPNTIEFVTTKFLDRRNLPYTFTFLGFTNPIKSGISITLNGHFSGSSKNTDYRSLTRKINVPKLFKLYFENTHDKFYIVTGVSIQKVPSGNRPLHVDYVASFFSPFGMLFDSTQQSGLIASTNSNDGDSETPIEKITGSVTYDQVVTIRDINDNGIQFTASASGTMTLRLVKISSSDNTTYLTNYVYVDVDGAEQVVKSASTSGNVLITLKPGQSIADLFTGTNAEGGDYWVNNITPTLFFRDGWASD